MKKQVKSVFNKKNLSVLTKKETKKIKGGNSSSDSTSFLGEVSGIVIEDIIQI